MLREDHPILFNDTPIPYMSGWSEEYETIENVFQTEAGTDDIDVTRYNKLSVSCSTVCFHDLLQTLFPFSKMASFTLTKFNPETGNDETRTVRMRDFKYSLKEDSWDLQTNGVWNVSFSLKEF